MKRLTYVVVILALIYSGYWAVGSYAVQNAAQTQLQTLEDDGWAVNYDTLKTRGYPSRFDTTVTNFSLQTPDRAVNYQAKIVQALALSYQPNRVIIALPDVQTLSVNDLPILIESDGFRASVGLSANTALSLDTITAEAAEATLTVAPDMILTLKNFLAAIRENTNIPNGYDTYLNVSEIALPSALRAQIDPQRMLPDQIEVATIDAVLALDRPLDRHTLAQWQGDPGQLRSLTLRSLNLKWGPFVISGDGAFDIDETGTLDGTVTLTASDWQGMLSVAQSAGLIPDQYGFMAQSIGQTLSAGAEDLVLPITVQNGNLSVGPLPLGPAPKFN